MQNLKMYLVATYTHLTRLREAKIVVHDCEALRIREKFVLRRVASRFSDARSSASDSLENFFDAGRQTRTRRDSILKARERSKQEKKKKKMDREKGG